MAVAVAHMQVVPFMPNRNQSQNSRPKRAPPCCHCNGINARCKFCACAKAGRACTCCLPAKHGKCSNGSVFSHGSAPMATQAMISSQPLPRPTAHSLETQQLSSLQPLLRQLQASSAAEHSSSLPSPPASSYTQSPQPSERHHSPGPDDLSQSSSTSVLPTLLSQFQLPSSPSLEGNPNRPLVASATPRAPVARLASAVGKSALV